MSLKKQILGSWVGVLLCLVSGCHSKPYFQQKGIDVCTRMSAVIFLDPIPPHQKTIFLQIRNISDKPKVDLITPITTALQAKGYQVVSLLDDAHYVLQINLLQFGYSVPSTYQKILNQGFGTTVEEAPFNVNLANHLGLQPLTYSTIADIQISERMGRSMTSKEKSNSKRKKNHQMIREITETEKIEWKRYQTRTISTINKARLSSKKATSLLIQGLTATITGIF